MTGHRCPTCKQPTPTPRQMFARVCRNCGQSIARHDKWRFVPVGKYVLIEHRHCDAPQSYVGKKGLTK